MTDDTKITWVVTTDDEVVHREECTAVGPRQYYLAKAISRSEMVAHLDRPDWQASVGAAPGVGQGGPGRLTACKLCVS